MFEVLVTASSRLKYPTELAPKLRCQFNLTATSLRIQRTAPYRVELGCNIEDFELATSARGGGLTTRQLILITCVARGVRHRSDLRLNDGGMCAPAIGALCTRRGKRTMGPSPQNFQGLPSVNS